MSSDDPILPDQTTDENDVGWSDDSDEDDERLLDELPPHHLDRD